MDKKTMVERSVLKELDIRSMASMMTSNFFGPADRKKICRNTFNEFLISAMLISNVNVILMAIEYLEKSNTAEITQDERIADFQLELVDLWNKLARSKLGVDSFTAMSLDDILKINPRELLQKCVRTG